ncbi:MAG: class I SAM-dependent methyltransferase [Alphaproteobacteria bacterium]|nr:class I SAM-dependent methyltransferase [Alphaproteobacteria bacterium]
MQSLIDYIEEEQNPESFEAVEVGSWVGASTLNWLDSFAHHGWDRAHITCCDAWENTYGLAGLEGHYPAPIPLDDTLAVMATALNTGVAEALFRHNIAVSGHKEKVTIVKGLSQRTLPRLRSEGFDMVFIDASHAYTQVRSDIHEAKRLVKDGGFVCGDDLELQWSECDRTAVEPYIEKDCIVDPGADRYFHPGVSKAVDEAFGSVSVYWGFWVMQRVGDEWRKVDLTGLPLRLPRGIGDKEKDLIGSFLQAYQDSFKLGDAGRQLRRQFSSGKFHTTGA